MDLLSLINGNANPCLERETRKWTSTTRLIIGPIFKAVALFSLTACILYVAICLHVFYVSPVFISPIYSFNPQIQSHASPYFKSYSYFLPNYHQINSYSNATPLMLPINTTPLMFPFYFSVSNTTPTLPIAINQIPSYNPSKFPKCFAPFVHLIYTILSFVLIYKPLSPHPPKLRCYNYCVIGNNLFINISYRLIYMFIYTTNAIHQAILAKSPIYVLGYYATTIYLGLHILF